MRSSGADAGPGPEREVRTHRPIFWIGYGSRNPKPRNLSIRASFSTSLVHRPLAREGFVPAASTMPSNDLSVDLPARGRAVTQARYEGFFASPQRFRREFSIDLTGDHVAGCGTSGHLGMCDNPRGPRSIGTGILQSV